MQVLKIEYPSTNLNIPPDSTILVWGIIGRWQPTSEEKSQLTIEPLLFSGSNNIVPSDEDVQGLIVKYWNDDGENEKTWRINILDDSCKSSLEEIYSTMKELYNGISV